MRPFDAQLDARYHARYLARMWCTQPYRTAIAIQRTLKKAIDDPLTKPIEVAQLARAWDCLEERKRVLKMRPAPKAIDVTPKKKRNAPAAPSFEE